MVTDKKGKIFEDRRKKTDRRTDDIEVKEDRRNKIRRSEDNKAEERRKDGSN